MKPMEPMQPMKPMEPMGKMKTGESRWWPESLGDSPNSAGSQNEMRYAYFDEKKRLAVDNGDGKISVYDTGEYRISGVQQAQSGDERSAVFTSQKGEVKLDELKKM